MSGPFSPAELEAISIAYEKRELVGV